MKNLPILYISCMLLFSCFHVTANAGEILLVAEMEDIVIDKNSGLIQVNSNSEWSFRVSKLVDGNMVDITNHPFIDIGASNPDRASLDNGKIIIHSVSSEHVNPDDYVLASILVFYYDETAEELGYLSIALGIK